MVENRPNIKSDQLPRRDKEDARPIGLRNSRTTLCDPTGSCATSCNSCATSSAASCGVRKS